MILGTLLTQPTSIDMTTSQLAGAWAGQQDVPGGSPLTVAT